MLIETKFNVGQELHFLSQLLVREKVDCVNCDKSGRLDLARGGRIDCNICFGKGVMEKPRSKWVVSGPLNVQAIFYDSVLCYRLASNSDMESSDQKGFSSFIFGITNFVFVDKEEDVCFDSKAEAIAECNKRNKELGHKPKLEVVNVGAPDATTEKR